MMCNRYTRILFVLGIIAITCGAVYAAEINVGTEPHVTSGVEAPACTVPGDECISETAAIEKWGVNGYEMSSKTICGQTADAMVQYFCIHPLGAAAPGSTPAAPVNTGAAAPAAPTAAAATQKASVHAATILAAIGAALLAAAGMRRK